MSDKLSRYIAAQETPQENRFWPLYGAGFENLGREEQPIKVNLPPYGPDQLLVRHDACGICFSDIKVINAGEQHPRIFRDMKKEPVVLGHEVAMTVVGVGEKLRDQYKVGDRFIIQADIWSGGVNYAYGYMIDGGMSWYGLIDQRVLNGDDGNYLIPVQPQTGYAESALAEPWACVIAAYHLRYRTGLKPGGATWIIGTPAAQTDYFFSAGFDEKSHPQRIVLTNPPAILANRVKEQAASLGVEVQELSLDAIRAEAPGGPVAFDDIIILGPDPDLIETASPYLADFGIVALMADTPLPRPVDVDMGRVHYNRWTYVGGPGPDIARAYSDHEVRAELRPGGKSWFVGAGGPMGQMHVQRAVQLANPPALLLCTDLVQERLDALEDMLGAEARAKGINFVCLCVQDSAYQQKLAELAGEGFDDIIGLVPVPPVISDSALHLAPRGVMNVFAGVKRGTMVTLDLSGVYLENKRFIGHTASTIDDLRLMLRETEAGHLSPNRSVAAIGSLEAAKDGYLAVRDAKFPGKVVIFPQIKEFPLTALSELKEKLPTVYARLKDGHEWTVEAEEEFLKLMLP
ncbi:MAG: alcohol dehydrogenase catalytic domain-containing protein [Anaerolineales bacterium]|nr:alcohol dehydrogenase catalytic domain-containing protein [Anaerolineales bacterium]